MKKLIAVLTVLLAVCIAGSLAAFADAPATGWNNNGSTTSAFTVNEDGSVSVSTKTTGNAFNQAVFTTPGGAGLSSAASDFAYRFHATIADNGGEQPMTFHYGILGGGQVNMTFYYQSAEGGRAWTNAVCGGENFSAYGAVAYTMTVAGQAPVGPNDHTAVRFDRFIAPLSGCALKAIDAAEGHDFIVRVTAIETGVLLRIYYGAEWADTALFYTLRIDSEAAKNTAASFLGFQIYESDFVLSDVICFDPNDSSGGEENPGGEDGVWSLINGNGATADFSAYAAERSFTVDDKDAGVDGFLKPQAVAKLSSLLGKEPDNEHDYALTATVSVSAIGSKYSSETQFWFYLYLNDLTNMGSAFQYNGMWQNAFTYALTEGEAKNAVSKSGNGLMNGGLSDEISNTALSLSGLLTGTAGRTRTFVTRFSLIEGKGVWQRIYLKGETEIDYSADVPVYQAMLETDLTDWNFAEASFGLRFFNATVSVTDVSVAELEKSSDGLSTGPTVTGDPGIWTVSPALPAASYDFGDRIGIDDSGSSGVSYGVSAITAEMDALAGSVAYADEQDIVIGLTVAMQAASRDMSLWFNLVDGSGNYIGVGFFYQRIGSEYMWTNSAVLSNSGYPISGYAYEKFGKTSAAFSDVSYQFAGVMGVPSVAGLNEWGSEEGHRFSVRYTLEEATETEGAKLSIRLYYGEEVNFYSEEEILKVVIFDFRMGDLSDCSFGFRAMCTEAELSDVSFDLFSALYADGEEKANQGNQGGNQGGEEKPDPVPGEGDEGEGCGSALSFGALLPALAAFVVAAFVLKRKKQ